jgi:hypothetical protein
VLELVVRGARAGVDRRAAVADQHDAQMRRRVRPGAARDVGEDGGGGGDGGSLASAARSLYDGQK